MRLPPNRCAFACCPPYGQGLDRGRPCEHCRKAHELAMDESYAEHLLEVASFLDAKIMPATDREARERLDQVAPVVTVLDTIRINDLMVWTEPI